ncbi:MAG: GDSL-type esterase/lipase family protein [Mariniblastus sp.]|nr:GDSL-type esterase/lipase family protein [Mariniblastus sp.]
MKKILSAMPLGVILLLLWGAVATAQPTTADPAERWEEVIRKFEARDAEQMPEPGQILFVGSSSIRFWDTERSFPEATIINRGFGGSQISDVNYFFDRVVAKYKPSIIVFYAGDNDIAQGESTDSVVSDFHQFWQTVRHKIPDCTVIYIPIKPSLSRWNLWPRMDATNGKIGQIASSQYNLRVADIVKPMLGSDGQPKPDLFARDGLHLSPKGYQIWTRVVSQLLKETTERMVVEAPEITRHGETASVSATVLVTDTPKNGPWQLDYRFDGQPWQTMQNGGTKRDWKFDYPGELDYGQHQLEIRLSPTTGSRRTITRSVKVIEE